MSAEASPRSFDYPRTERVVIGAGALAAAGAEAERLGCSRALLLSTPSLRGGELEAQLAGSLGELRAGSSHESRQHVPLDSVSALIEAVAPLEPDLIVSLGGGSVIDAGKALAAALAHGYGDGHGVYEHRIVFEYPATIEQRPFEREPIPHLAVPTTLSAAEYDGIFGMTHEGTKDLYLDPRLVPRVVLLDPLASAATPPALWAGTGMRALDHAIEIYLSRSPSPPTDAACLQAIRLLFENLLRSLEQPGDLAARERCLEAAWLSMFGVENVTLGLSHGIGHQIGARCGVPHGVTSCLMLPAVLEFMLEAMPDRLADVAAAAGADVGGLSSAEAAALAPGLVRDLIAALGLPARLSEVGVAESDLALIAADSMRDFVVASAPVEVTEADVLALLAAVR